MHFTAEHEYPAPRAAVAAVLCDPDFHTTLDLPDLSRPEVLASTTEGSTHVLRLRYEYIGQIDAIARRVLAGRDLTWLQNLQLDTATYSGSLTFASEADPKRLHGEATVILDALDDAHTRRRIAGDLHVKVPLIGGTAERRIVPGLVRRLDVEAEAAARRLTSP